MTPIKTHHPRGQSHDRLGGLIPPAEMFDRVLPGRFIPHADLPFEERVERAWNRKRLGNELKRRGFVKYRSSVGEERGRTLYTGLTLLVTPPTAYSTGNMSTPMIWNASVLTVARVGKTVVENPSGLCLDTALNKVVAAWP
jgi:hypothetical protein